ncbi:MAG: glycosyltransferase [Fibrobacterota bacterium]
MKPPPPIRVLHIIHRLDRDRGSTSWLLVSLSNKSQYPIQHLICSTSAEPGDREEEFIRAGIPVVHIPLSYAFPFPYIIKLIKLLKSSNCDVLHSHMAWHGGFDVLAGFIARVKLRIVYFHSGDWLFAHHPLRAIFARFLKALCLLFGNQYWGASKGVLQNWFSENAEHKKNVKPVHGGIRFNTLSLPGQIESKKMLGLPGESKVIAHIGRFTYQKNHEMILTVFKEVLIHDNNCFLVLIGDGPLLKDTRQLADELGIAGHVKFLGVRTDIAHCLNAMDVFFLPSRYEPLGLVLLEAQDIGLPIVASDIQGLKEAVAPIWSHNLISVNDTKGFSKTLINALSEKRQRPDSFLDFFSEENASRRLYQAYKSNIPEG